MDLDSVSNELYAAKREEFTALRDERAKQARPDRLLVDKIAGLRKPTVAAWLVNQVSRACPEEIDRLEALGESLRDAHQRLAGGELRSLSRERHEVIDLLAQRAHWLARKAGYAFGDATERQVIDTFEAALGDVRALEAIRAARLSAALAPGSPETWLAGAFIPASPASDRRNGPARAAGAAVTERREADETTRTRGTAGEAERTRGKTSRTQRVRATGKADRARREKAERSRREEDEAAARARREADRARQQARRAAEEARQKAEEAAEVQNSAEQALAEAEEALADAEQAAEHAATTVRDLQARLEEAQAADRDARAGVTAARKTVTTARRTAKSAGQRATQAEEHAADAEARAAELE